MTLTAIPRAKRCSRCRVIQPVTEYRANGQGTPENVCRTCRNQQRHGRAPSRARLVARRTRQRATAVLLRNHDDEFRTLMDELRPGVEHELDQLGEDTRLSSGPRREGQDVTDRIRELCDHCAEAHQAGHKCEVCGSTPGKPVRSLSLARGELRFGAGETVVVKP